MRAHRAARPALIRPVPVVGVPPLGTVWPVVALMGTVTWVWTDGVVVPSGAVWVTVMLCWPPVKGCSAWQLQLPSDATVVEQTGLPESLTATL